MLDEELPQGVGIVDRVDITRVEHGIPDPAEELLLVCRAVDPRHDDTVDGGGRKLAGPASGSLGAQRLQFITQRFVLLEALLDALRMANQCKAKRKLIAYLSDGGATCMDQDEAAYRQETLQAVAAANTQRVKINTIAVLNVEEGGEHGWGHVGP